MLGETTIKTHDHQGSRSHSGGGTHRWVLRLPLTSAPVLFNPRLTMLILCFRVDPGRGDLLDRPSLSFPYYQSHVPVLLYPPIICILTIILYNLRFRSLGWVGIPLT